MLELLDPYRITDLPEASTVDGTEWAEIVQAGVNKKILSSKLISSAYTVAVAQGFSGTVGEWLDSLKGDNGLSAYQVAVEQGYGGDVLAWLLSLKGADGKSAYELAVQGGFQGDQTAWLASLVGAAGASAYQVALSEGFSGTASAWLLSLRGESGTLWHPVTAEPAGELGSVNDYAYNTVSKEFYLKTGASTWTLQGTLGGLQEAPEDGGSYVRKDNGWTRLDRIDLSVASTTDTLDLAVRQVFRVDATSNKTLVFANAPGADRAMSVVVKLLGSGGIITWPAGIAWDNDTAPELGATFTTIVLFWDGTSWDGGVSRSA